MFHTHTHSQAKKQPAFSNKQKKISFPLPSALACASSEFTCGDGSCIPDYLKCNGVRDCRDGSDENPSDCFRSKLDVWNSEIWLCAKMKTLIYLSLSLQVDQHVDATLANGNVHPVTVFIWVVAVMDVLIALTSRTKKIAVCIRSLIMHI